MVVVDVDVDVDVDVESFVVTVVVDDVVLGVVLVLLLVVVGTEDSRVIPCSNQKYDWLLEESEAGPLVEIVAVE